MEGVGELINTMKELKGELVKVYKTIAEKETEVKKLLEEKAEKEAEAHKLLEKIAVLERHLQSEGDANDKEPEVKVSPILERKAEEIIPKECWGIVLQNLNGEDLLSCRQVCKTFNQLLDLRGFKEQWKFKVILPLLFPYFKANDLNTDTWKHLFNARSTCKSWRHWIDQYVSEMHGANVLPFRTREMPLLTRFRTSDDIKEFQEKFRECNGNPFPSRSVYISNPDEEEGDSDEYYNAQAQLQDAYIAKIGELLEQFGKHIFKLRLRFRYEHSFGPNLLTVCKLIKRISNHVPNLKELLIVKRPNVIIYEEQEEEEIASYILENALAPLPKLRALRVGGLDKKMVDYLLDAFGPQLTQMESLFSENLQFKMQQLKNVRQLWLGLDEPCDVLGSLRFLQSPLKHLKLTCRFGSTQKSWNMDKVLCNLKHLSINSLEIEIWNVDQVNLAEAGIDIEEYNNASIKTLIIHIDRPNFADGHQISFNFLSSLTQLECLKLRFSGEQLRTSHPGELPEVVKLNEYLFGGEKADLPYHSNVWEKVPSLKTFMVRRDGDELFESIYTRGNYDSIIADENGLGQN